MKKGVDSAFFLTVQLFNCSARNKCMLPVLMLRYVKAGMVYERSEAFRECSAYDVK